MPTTDAELLEIFPSQCLVMPQQETKMSKVKITPNKLQIREWYGRSLWGSDRDLWAGIEYCKKTVPHTKPSDNDTEIIRRARGNIKAYREELRESRLKRSLIAYKTLNHLSVAASIPFSKLDCGVVRNLHKRLHSAVCDARAQSKRAQLDPVSTHIGSTVGGVHLQPGLFERYFNRNKIDACFQGKRPHTKTNHVGVEIECFVNCSDRELASAFAAAKLHNHVEIKDDGSLHYDPDHNDCDGSCHEGGDDCDNGDCGCDHNSRCSSHGMMAVEVVVIALEDKYREIITKVCKVLHAHGAEVNKTCGLHIHFDQRSRDRHRSYKNLFNALPMLQSMIPESRRKNNYAKPNKYDTYTEQQNNCDRYYAINTNAYGAHQTLEVRMHSGTTDRIKIIRWIDTLLACMDRTGQQTNVVITDPIQLLHLNRISARLHDWIASRIEKFRVHATPHLRSLDGNIILVPRIDVRINNRSAETDVESLAEAA